MATGDATTVAAAGRPQPQTTGEPTGGPFIRHSAPGRRPVYSAAATYGLYFGPKMVAAPGWYRGYRLKFTNTSGGAVTFQQSNLRVLHGLFGPKVSTGGPVRVFLTVKGGFENFRFDPTPASFSAFTSSVGNLRSSNVSGVVYPGLGIEGFLGPIGLRLDAGDEIYCANGARHNLRISFGPTIRF